MMEQDPARKREITHVFKPEELQLQEMVTEVMEESS